ncbi:MAG TPA: prolyl oligopeptidase family serine peptidase [Trebonia sp.]|jgi:dipeptidyl-peptidase-4|nr:prolyl oligopeptidase family serine peptidase [Trebonia sp.]
MAESFPRQRARTRNFSFGVPRAFQVSPDGGRITFVRTKGGADPVGCLWELALATGRERVIADPRRLGAGEENLPPEERARRERVRETGAGIVSYTTDAACAIAAFPLSGEVYTVRLNAADEGEGNQPVRIGTRTPALEPRIDPAGKRIGYVHEGSFRVFDLETGADTLVASEPGHTFGLAEFVAAEEMGRARGYWWSPDGTEVLLARVNEGPVSTWHIADPANPDREPVRWKYPAAGTPNARVDLFIASLTAGELAKAAWDDHAFPYLVTANWAGGADPLIVTQTRDQKTMRVSGARTGEVLIEDKDPDWTDVIDGVPARLDGGPDGGLLVWTRISDGTRRLVVAAPGDLASAPPVTPAGLYVRRVLGTDGDSVLFTASTDPAEIGVWRYGPGGLTAVATSPGVHAAVAGGGTTVVISRDLAGPGVTACVNETLDIASTAQTPNLPAPAPRFLAAGPDGIAVAVLFPSWHRPGTKLPVLMAPYGGPGHQEVLAAAAVYLQNQWFAEQGFAVVTADGHGTPGRSPVWERGIAGDFATRVLEDQVTALRAAAAEFPDLDTSRVGIRGWSFGGYLSALAVLRRPDVFAAAVAGAPVTDWRLYDTHYTERYLGDPAENPAAYEASSLIHDPERVLATDHRALLVIHGLADDNVLVAHSLRLSSALLAAGYPHSVLPLSGITHMTAQETVAENLLLLQVAFLRSALGAEDGGRRGESRVR